MVEVAGFVHGNERLVFVVCGGLFDTYLLSLASLSFGCFLFRFLIIFGLGVEGWDWDSRCRQ